MNDQLIKRVIGLKYEEGLGLPKVILKGCGRMADEIINERNKKSRVPIVRDEKLLNDLYRLPVDAEIGSELFELVAVLLVHVYAIDGKSKEIIND